MSEELPQIELTADQEKAWDATRAALVWHCPAFTHILYTMLNNNSGKHVAMFVGPESGIPVAATDGTNLLIVPEPFFKLTLQERIFVVAHEIAHAMFGHMELIFKIRMTGKVRYPDGKELPYDHGTMNKAMDYVINDMLIKSKIGDYNSSWLHDPVIATYEDDVLTAYRRILQQNKKGGQSGQNGQNGKSGQQGFDKHMDPGQSQGQNPQQAAGKRSEVEWKTAIAGAMATAKAQGKLPGALERVFSELVEPKVDWRDKIVGFFARKVGSGTYDWRKPDRRLVTRGIIAPGRSGYGAGTVVIGVDTSGSVGQRELDLFFGEVSGVLEDVRPQRVVLMFCDASVNRVDEVEDMSDLMDVRKRGAPGGGGTAFTPVFEKVRELGLEPDALLYLTDGMGSFPAKEPSYPVMWGNVYPGSKFPWGEVVDLPMEG